MRNLQPAPGAVPTFAQLYVYDGANAVDSASLRLGHMRLPQNTSAPEKSRLAKLCTQLCQTLEASNPYVRDFQNIASLPAKHKCRSANLVLNERERPRDVHAKVYGLPSGMGMSELSVMMEETPGKRDLVLQMKDEDPQAKDRVKYVSETHRSYDPLHMVLVHPSGQDGWTYSLKGPTGCRVSARAFYAYRLMQRNTESKHLLRAGRLFQEYACMGFAKYESLRLQWVRLNQSKLRSHTYAGLKEAVDAGEHLQDGVGQKVLLPSSFMGGPRDMTERYHDAMAICAAKGKPDYFITMTCNPKWPEITAALLPGQSPGDRPDLVARVFKLRLQVCCVATVAPVPPAHIDS
jgi:hypothetical protein